MANLRLLLEKGYFSYYLPEPFNTESYASAVTEIGLTLPQGFRDKKKTAYTIKHNVPNLGLKRRQIGIPNPVRFYLLAENIVNNWDNIQSHLQHSSLSKSKPNWNEGATEDSNGATRAIIHEMSFQDRDDEKRRIRGLSKYVLTTDISRFYGSIYTHSIPWAIHGKDFAKVNRGDEHCGNLLDKNARNGQGAQTVGIPIGPDTSIVLAEIVLCGFDILLQEQLPNLVGFRYVDDFELGFKTYDEAEQALSVVRKILSEYELELNNSKTQIVKLPDPINVWVGELRYHRIRKSRSDLQKHDLRAYFDKAIHFSQLYSSHALSYAISRLKSVDVKAENWSITQSFIFQCMISESGTLFKCLQLLQKMHNKGYPIDLDQLEHILDYLIVQNCMSGHLNEIAWALWAALFWRLNIGSNAAEALSSITDSVVALMTLHAHQSGLVSHEINLDKWASFVNSAEELYSSQWLLAYEANVKGWLPFTTDYVLEDENFSFLKRHGVEFYDTGRVQLPLTRFDVSYILRA